MLRYGEESSPVRLLCGFLQCDAIDFEPLRQALQANNPVSQRAAPTMAVRWEADYRQMVTEVDVPHSGGIAMLARLTEILHRNPRAPHHDDGGRERPAGLRRLATGRCRAASPSSMRNPPAIGPGGYCRGRARLHAACWLNGSRPYCRRRRSDICATGGSISPASLSPPRAVRLPTSRRRRDTRQKPLQPRLLPRLRITGDVAACRLNGRAERNCRLRKTLV